MKLLVLGGTGGMGQETAFFAQVAHDRGIGASKEKLFDATLDYEE
jgi:hypothetical protein